MPRSLSLFICLLTGLNLFGQQLNLQTGHTFAFEYKVTTNGQYNSATESTYNFKVLGKDDSGNYRLECVLGQLKKTEPGFGGGSISLNTGDIRQTRFESTSSLIPLSILGKPFEVVLDSSGHTIEIKGVEAMLKTAAETWQLQDELKTQLLGNLPSLKPEITSLHRHLRTFSIK